MVQDVGVSLMAGVDSIINASSASWDGSADQVNLKGLSTHQRQSERVIETNEFSVVSDGFLETGVEFYLYVFLGVVIALAGGSLMLYCFHQRRLRHFVNNDNANNNIQRYLLEDSALQDGQEEWQCSVCYHDNHPAKKECLMCGTPEGTRWNMKRIVILT
ncbi:hypothetical protein DVH05_027908 [Phytophthora capsici]|nr:hypothetical protein DVH05_027908 [Phytophthora capsici]